MMAMFFDTGMRLTEVITLRAEQIREDSIIVHGKGNKERLVPVSPYLAKALLQYQMAREAYFEGKLPERYLFVSKTGKRLTQEGITKFMKKAAADVGVNCNIRVSPHTFRHTPCLHCVKNFTCAVHTNLLTVLLQLQYNGSK